MSVVFPGEWPGCLVAQEWPLPLLHHLSKALLFFKGVSRESLVQAEGTALHTCLQLRSLFSFPSVVYGSPKDSLCPVELSLRQVCAVLEAEGSTPSPVSPPGVTSGRAQGWHGQDVECGGSGAGWSLVEEWRKENILSERGQGERAKFLERGPRKEGADDMKK